MSSALAVASVTQVLKRILSEGLDASEIANLGVELSARSPDKMETNTANVNHRLNLFLYLVTPNQGWRNRGYPSHNARGERVGNPPLALDLHYVLSAYSDEDLIPEMILGSAMRLLHEQAVLTRKNIRLQLIPEPSDSLSDNLAKALAASGLAEQIEQIKITPEILNTEEMSRLWTAFGAKYRPSAFYKLSVVLIEGRKSTKAALPVKKSLVYVQPFHQPVLTKINSLPPLDASEPGHQKILAGYRLVLNGTQLKGQITSVLLGSIEIPNQDVNFTNLSETQIVFPLPADLKAGVHTVQIIHKTTMGEPPEPRTGFSSNVEAFVLSPQLIEVEAVDAPEEVNVQKFISLKITPIPRETQQIMLLLNQISENLATDTPRAYVFEQLAGSSDSEDKIRIPIQGVEPGEYLVRVRVDHAESPVGDDYQSPKVEI